MQYDFGSLPSSCKLEPKSSDTPAARSKTTGANNDDRTPTRSTKRAKVAIKTPFRFSQQNEDDEQITWQNSSSPVALSPAALRNQQQQNTRLSHLRDISNNLYANKTLHDPASELRAKFIPDSNAYDSLSLTSSRMASAKKKKIKKVGRIMSLPASHAAASSSGVQEANVGSIIGRMLDNLERKEDNVKEEPSTVQSRSLPSSPPQHAEDDIDSDEEEDWDQLERAVEIKRQLSVMEEEIVKTSAPKAESHIVKLHTDDLSDLDINELDAILVSQRPPLVKKEQPTLHDSKNEELTDSDEDDIDLGELDEQIQNIQKVKSERSKFRLDSTAKMWEEAEEKLDIQVSRTDVERMVITCVSMCTYTENARELEQCIATATTTRGEKTLYIRDMWLKCPLSIRDVVHVIGDYDKSATEITIDNNNNLLVVHPDHLITATNIADSFYCERKIVLRERIRQPGTSIISKQILYGDLVHRLFEICLQRHNFKREFMTTQIRQIVENEYFESIIMLGLTLDELLAEMDTRIGQLIQFRNRYVQKQPHMASKVQVHRLNKEDLASVSNVIDTEEDVWSPVFGLQGKIDATVEATVKAADGTLTRHLVPLELKTAQFNRTVGHRAQTTLYCLMMADRYALEVSFGFLYYSETCDMHMIPVFHDEVAALLAQRNYLASFMKTRDGLPEPLEDDRRCTRCNQASECMVYHKCTEQGTAQSAGIDNMFFDETDHLTEHHIEFFKHWTTLMDKESMEGSRFRKEIWTMDSKAREESDRCFGNLRIKPMHDGVKEISDKSCTYVFERVPSDPRPLRVTDSQLFTSDRIVISDELGHFCLALGYIRSINDKEIEVQVNTRLENTMKKRSGFDPINNQVFVPRLTGERDSTGSGGAQVFRIDLDPFEKSMSLARGNMMQLFVKNGSEKLRRMIVDLETPKFADSPISNHFQVDVSEYNGDQLKAVDMVSRAHDYTLILGMPGTGKTTTIAGIIKGLVAAGKSILLTSYTHSAVDNICLKIKDQGFEICRLASTMNRVHPDCRDLVPVFKEGDELTKEVTEKKYLDPLVVATTCLSINHWIFGLRKFDYCIVDEASQLTMPVCVGPLRLADKFILVGDHYQLQPMVKNQEAANGGLKTSLFERLSIAHPEASVNLAHQYRMCRDIMLLSNELVYEGKLECGSDEVADQCLKIPSRAKLDTMKKRDSKHWLGHVAEETNRVVFLNTDEVDGAEETRIGQRIQNMKEAEIVSQIVEAFCACGVAEKQIGLITPYRAQLKVLSSLMRQYTGVEALTADRFQGRDKDCIIISLVRNNSEGNIGDLLNDWRRLNVTFTRAKSKLLLLGSRNTLERDPRLKQFLQLIDQNNWSYDLPKDCTEVYDFPGVVSIDSSIRSPAKSTGKAPPRSHPSQSLQSSPKSKSPSRSVAKHTVGSRVLEGKPSILRDIVNDLK